MMMMIHNILCIIIVLKDLKITVDFLTSLRTWASSSLS
jgi:hypothetical protein